MKFINVHEVYRNSGLGKWFHDESAGGKPGWDRYNSSGKRVGECGDAKKGSSYAACLSKQKAAKLGKKGIANFVKRKRAAQSAAGRGKKGSGGKGKKPINVDTGASKMNECSECQSNSVINFITEGLELLFEGKNKPKQPKKWNSCIAAAKQKFDVYPSAYANAWAAKCYKKKGGGWKKVVKEETEKEKPSPEALEKLKNDTKFIKLGTREGIKESFAKSLKVVLEGKDKKNLRKLFAKREGNLSQRTKLFGKGGKAGTEKTQSRREGRKQANEINY